MLIEQNLVFIDETLFIANFALGTKYGNRQRDRAIYIRSDIKFVQRNDLLNYILELICFVIQTF